MQITQSLFSSVPVSVRLSCEKPVHLPAPSLTVCKARLPTHGSQAHFLLSVNGDCSGGWPGIKHSFRFIYIPACSLLARNLGSCRSGSDSFKPAQFSARNPVLPTAQGWFGAPRFRTEKRSLPCYLLLASKASVRPGHFSWLQASVKGTFCILHFPRRPVSMVVSSRGGAAATFHC